MQKKIYIKLLSFLVSLIDIITGFLIFAFWIAIIIDVLSAIALFILILIKLSLNMPISIHGKYISLGLSFFVSALAVIFLSRLLTKKILPHLKSKIVSLHLALESQLPYEPARAFRPMPQPLLHILVNIEAFLNTPFLIIICLGWICFSLEFLYFYVVHHITSLSVFIEQCRNDGYSDKIIFIWLGIRITIMFLFPLLRLLGLWLLDKFKIPFDYRSIYSFNYDYMEGHSFEFFCADLLKYNGYSNIHVTPASGDQGIDIIANKGQHRYAIQCKRYASRVGNAAVQEANAGKAFYNCDVAAVITNNFFTPSAIALAKQTNVILWNRNDLERFIANYVAKKDPLKLNNAIRK